VQQNAGWLAAATLNTMYPIRVTKFHQRTYGNITELIDEPLFTGDPEYRAAGGS